MPSNKRVATSTVALLLPIICSYGQGTNQSQTPEPDVLICKDGEKLVGHLISSNDSSLVFKSDAAGQVSVDWGKVQELRSSTKFAVVPKGVQLRAGYSQRPARDGVGNRSAGPGN